MKSIKIRVAVLVVGLFLVWFVINIPQADIFSSIIYHGVSNDKEKIVALTFDDGPYGEPTKKILDILKEKNVKATFFVVGNNAEKYPDLVKREAADGHLIGNHSLDHSPNLADEKPEDFKKNIIAADEKIYETTGLHPRFFRPPFGLTSSAVLKVLHDLKYEVIFWDDMTNDWDATQKPEDIAARIIKRLKPGAIIVLHDGRDTKINYPREDTTKALPMIIDQAREKGYEFIQLDQLVGKTPYFNSNNSPEQN